MGWMFCDICGSRKKVIKSNVMKAVCPASLVGNCPNRAEEILEEFDTLENIGDESMARGFAELGIAESEKCKKCGGISAKIRTNDFKLIVKCLKCDE